ncbi:MAG: VWA domain-containing protein [Alphaproteobacteria bacterium]|nr:VWA domain-containing protein [Alphaproteobacteria bacterium]
MTAPALIDAPSTGGRLVTLDGKALPFRGGLLSADAMGGLCRVSLRQAFVNPHAEPLRVSYTLPLPADAAVVGFSFELDGERIVGEIDKKQRARQRFEEALVEGRTAAILDQERSSVFTQEVGNVPPGAEIHVEILLDLPLRWVDRAGADGNAAGGWELRFPTVVAPRFLGEPGRTPDAGKVSVDVVEGGAPPRMALAVGIRDAITGAVSSPTHALTVHDAPGLRQVGLSQEGGAALDRDLVVRWPVAAPKPGASLDTGRPAAGWPDAPQDRSAHAYGLLTLVPPVVAGPDACGRDLIVLIDTSGSQSGMPMTQSKAMTVALLESLGDGDSIELIEFSNHPRRWRKGAVAATADHKRDAIAWVNALRAGGATQMREGIEAALAGIRGESQRQVVLITDGLIGFEREIVERVKTGLPQGSRVHTVGVASGVNRSLTGPVARAGGGIELILDLDEDPAEAARRLVAATAAPQVVDLRVSGDALDGVACHRVPDLMAGRPTRVALRLKSGGGTLHVTGRSAEGQWEHSIAVPALAAGAGNPAMATLYARECVEEAELDAACGQSVDARIEALGLSFQISTRLTSWVAVSRETTVDPQAATRTETVPQALPYGMSAQGLGLRGAGAPLGRMRASAMPASLAMDAAAGAAPPPAPSGMPRPQAELRRAAPRPAAKKAKGLFQRLADAFGGGADEGEAAPMSAEQAAPEPMGAAFDARSEAKEEGAFEPPVEKVVAEESVLYDAPADLDDEAPVARPAPFAPLVLAMTVLLRAEQRLVVSLALAVPLAWQLPGKVMVYLADGRRVEVPVDASGSTRSGALAAGQSVRLDLRGLDFERADVVEVHFAVHGQPVIGRR